MNQLLGEIDVLEIRGDASHVSVTGVEHDSREVEPGDLYCCLPGSVTDGHRFAPDAVRRGAVGLVCEHFVALEGSVATPGTPGASVSPAPAGIAPAPVVQVRVAEGQARPTMARLAAAVHGHPARDLTMVAVTGTNGKTTVTHLVESVLRASGRPCEVIGTLSGARTTPESDHLQARLAEVRDRAIRDGRRATVSMEVSSHALAQARVDAIRFDVAVFTNLSHDHLDFHGDMESYFAAKASLFTPARAARAVIDVDDPWGRRLARGAGVPVVPVGRDAASDLRLAPGHTEFHWRDRRVVTALTGRFNVDNCLLAAEALVALDLEPSAVVEGLAAARPVPGRFEMVGRPTADRCSVMVDYAHTPAALETALAASRELIPADARLLVVFGCGGDRDHRKRPVMGRIAASLADTVIVTDDNPRHENPADIIASIVAGTRTVPGGATVVVEADRRAAIAGALEAAGPGDLVVVAGKGHETTQDFGDRVEPFDDRAVVASLLATRSEP